MQYLYLAMKIVFQMCQKLTVWGLGMSGMKIVDGRNNLNFYCGLAYIQEDNRIIDLYLTHQCFNINYEFILSFNQNVENI